MQPEKQESQSGWELDAVRRKQDENVQRKVALRRAQDTADEFYAWMGRWEKECEGVVPADAHSRLVFDSLAQTAKQSRLESSLALERAFEECREEELTLAVEEERLIEQRSAEGPGEPGPEGGRPE